MSEEIKELLNRTKQCIECKGTGFVDNQNNTTEAKIMCQTCNGSGMILDSFITDEMIKNGIKGKAMVEFAEKIYTHYAQKLYDAYQRGISESKETMQSEFDKISKS